MAEERSWQGVQFGSDRPANAGGRSLGYERPEGGRDDADKSQPKVLVGKKKSSRKRPFMIHFSEPKEEQKKDRMLGDKRVPESIQRREESRSMRESGMPTLPNEGLLSASEWRKLRSGLSAEELYAFSVLQQQASLEMQKITEERIRRYAEIQRARMEQLPAAKRLAVAFGRPREKEGPARRRRKHRPMRLERARLSEADIEIKKTKRGNKIESFADFSDSLFNYRIVDDVKSFICPHPGCKMELPSMSRIKRHYIVHTKLKPFKCLNVNCGKKFSRKDNMLQHFRIHCEHKSTR
jgi:hypothetical protein